MDTRPTPVFDYSIEKAHRQKYAKIDEQKQIRTHIANEHTIYTIQIMQINNLSAQSEFKTVERRYSDFEDMHNAIKEERKGLILPALPPKNHVLNGILGFKFSQTDRKFELELYLNKLMSNKEVRDVDAFIDFTTKVNS